MRLQRRGPRAAHVERRCAAARAAALALAVLATGLVDGRGAGASTPRCTHPGTPADDIWTVSRTPSRPGEVLPDAVVCGGAGDDTIRTPGPPFRGTFRGGSGHDSVGVIGRGGTFIGGRGRDRVRLMQGGVFLGGPGGDGLRDMEGGSFAGAGGANRTSVKAVAVASADLALRIAGTDAPIRLVSLAFVRWGDTSLGCPEEGRVHPAVVTPGHRVVLEAGTERYVYHTDREWQAVLASHGGCP